MEVGRGGSEGLDGALDWPDVDVHFEQERGAGRLRRRREGQEPAPPEETERADTGPGPGPAEGSDRVFSRPQAQFLRGMEERLARALAATLEDHRLAQERWETATAASLASTEQGVRDLDQRVADLGASLGASTERGDAESQEFEEAVSAALAEVAAQLERAVSSSGDTREIVGTIADGLDAFEARIAALGHALSNGNERIAAGVDELHNHAASTSLQPMRSSLTRMETLLESLADVAAQPTPRNDRVTEVLDRVERLSDSRWARAEAAMSVATQAVSDAETRLRTAATAANERPSTAAVVRLEAQLKALARANKKQEQATARMFDNVATAIRELAAAQAEAPRPLARASRARPRPSSEEG